MYLARPNNRASRGRWFQELVKAACTHYLAQQRAFIREVPVPMGIGKGGFEAFFKDKSITDFIGILRGGRAVAFDAKSSLESLYKSGVVAHQLEAMDIIHRLGGISGILIGFHVQGSILSWWVPWPTAGQLASGGWTPTAVAALPGAVAVRFVGYVDFLPALENA